MTKHPKAGQPVKIANGPLKDKYYVVHDWYINQYQGKQMEKLIETRSSELVAVKRRGYPLDTKLVWGRLYPTMEWMAVHDDELSVQMKIMEGGGEKVELPPNVEPMSKKRKPKVVKGGSSGKEVASKTTEAGSSPATPAKKETEDGPPTAS